ncbi:acetoacetate decarboxylase [Ochrobactrum sp. P6BS-III]|uniref:acetoacetate decarboxylase n=1 Tax=unclassified Ochrobactrum TaxID=239106 RepID=UPI000993F1EC|nr:acetoacetate decarboxylase [Ochrobactrum sp. P6BSIII]OOL15519.1 acetoacetate decarboxylase [Ochrobactrum sp. P6BS-III]
MDIDRIRQQAYAMPLTSPSFGRGPFRFCNREFLVLTYRTDMDALRAVVPEPLEVHEPIVHYEFIRMPDSAGFGSYTESGQVIPVSLHDVKGSYTHAMYLDDHAPIAGGREIWGFPKKFAQPRLEVVQDTLIGTLDYGPVRIATGTMGYKYQDMEQAKLLDDMKRPGFLLKIIPHVDGSLRICELVQYHMGDIRLQGAWSGPGALELHPHALAPVAKLPVREVLSASHYIADLTLMHGRVVHDYLA